MLYRRRRSKFSELVPNPFAKRSCNKICSNQIRKNGLIDMRNYLKLTIEQLKNKAFFKKTFRFSPLNSLTAKKIHNAMANI